MKEKQLIPEEKQITHHFLEWHLAYALKKTYDSNPDTFWNTFWNEEIIETIDKQNIVQSLKDLYGNQQANFYHEKWLPKKGAKDYGILDEDYYSKTFYGLTPDFRIETPDHSLVVLLEAKRWLPPSSIPPKEQRYIQFLKDATIPQHKGFFYIITEKGSTEYLQLLKKHNTTNKNVDLGIITWENLLPLIGDKLFKEATLQLLEIARALNSLHTWQEQQTKTTKAPP